MANYGQCWINPHFWSRWDGPRGDQWIHKLCSSVWLDFCMASALSCGCLARSTSRSQFLSVAIAEVSPPENPFVSPWFCTGATKHNWTLNHMAVGTVYPYWTSLKWPNQSLLGPATIPETWVPNDDLGPVLGSKVWPTIWDLAPMNRCYRPLGDR